METKRALVVSDSPIARDPRVLRQIQWFVDAGFEVDSLGRGARPSELNGTHFDIPRRSSLTRVLSYLFLPNRLKYRVLTGSMIPSELARGGGNRRYDVIAMNEIELLPWLVRYRSELVTESGHVHLDLHEYAPSQRTGLMYRLVFKRWRDYLISFIGNGSFDTRSVVAEGIADLYRDLFAMARPAVIRNCPPYQDLPVRPTGDRIRLVHHGVASMSRGLDIVIEAMGLVDDRFTLDLMLVGPTRNVDQLKQDAKTLGDKVLFRDPVDVRLIPETINTYDAEVIFFPPVTENLRFVLPNKFFEAVQARLAVVAGDSIEMTRIMAQYENGVVANGWTARDLAAAISSLTIESVDAMKVGSDRAAHELSAEREKQKFLELVTH